MCIFVSFSFLASNVLTVPPPCSTSTTSVEITSDNETSSTNTLLTIEEINEILKKQIQKLEDSSNVEVYISKQLYKNKFSLFCI